MINFLELLQLNPTVAAVRNEEEFEKAILSPVAVVFHLNANILYLEENVRKAKNNGKVLFIHIDMADGIGKDITGLKFIKKSGADGIISTRTNMIKLAREVGLFSVQRFFMVDSHSLITALENIKLVKPDMIEIMPGVIPSIISEIKNKISTPLIAGGFIESKEDAIRAIKAGASGISTGKEVIWYA